MNPEAGEARPELATAVADTDVAGSIDDGTYVPPMLLVVFGLPIFLVLIYFFMQFTRPDRFGRIDRSLVDALASDEDGDEDLGEDDEDLDEDDVIDEDEA